VEHDVGMGHATPRHANGDEASPDTAAMLLDQIRAIAGQEDQDEWDAADRLGRIRELLGGEYPTLDTPEKFLEYARGDRDRAVLALQNADRLITLAKGEIQRRAGH
jgi:hypothetical protein